LVKIHRIQCVRNRLTKKLEKGGLQEKYNYFGKKSSIYKKYSLLLELEEDSKMSTSWTAFGKNRLDDAEEKCYHTTRYRRGEIGIVMHFPCGPAIVFIF